MTHPICWMCETVTGLRMTTDGGGYVPPEFVCVECFTEQDDGPCFNDLTPYLPFSAQGERERMRTEAKMRARAEMRASLALTGLRESKSGGFLGRSASADILAEALEWALEAAR